jgi:Tannase and feruloyl esterase
MMRFRISRTGYAACAMAFMAIGLLTAVSAADRNATASEAGVAILPKISCDELANADFSAAVGARTRITRVAEATPADGEQYCVVTGVISPEIRFEVRLPTSGWTGRYLQIGCGGLCGNLTIHVDHADGCVPVTQHQIVLASTDMGHSGQGGQWAQRNPAKRADFGYRGVHLTAVASRATITAYYGESPRYSYFSGCSDGGREALIEAQRYSEDFDGIAAGAPALNFTVQNSFYHAWNALSNSDKSGKAILEAAQLPLLHAAVVKACDQLDGDKDGIIEDPRSCRFDPVVLQCASGADGSDCLSAAQVETARKIYAGAHDANGTKLVMAGPMPGSELAWVGVFVPATPGGPILSRTYASDSLRYLLYEQPLPAAWSLNDFQFTVETLQSLKMRGLYDATNPDLSAFRKRGGKLLMWHGWSDQHISPINSIGYYEAVARRMGINTVQSFARLFLIPGLYHCSGGEGPIQFDVISALMDWVENDTAPEALQLSPEGTVQSTSSSARPVFPYPDKARRVESISIAQAGAYRRVKGNFASRPLDWAGARFFTSGYELNCDSGKPSQCAGQNSKTQH